MSARARRGPWQATFEEIVRRASPHVLKGFMLKNGLPTWKEAYAPLLIDRRRSHSIEA
jgi:hypothetical protein